MGWIRHGTSAVEADVAALADGDLSSPSGLPGWSRAHVVSHVARNADALGNLLIWAQTGVETPMYANPARRAEQIEDGARRPAADIRADLLRSDEHFDAVLAATEGSQWDTVVRTVLGREVPAHEVPWLRVREIWIHRLDLDPTTVGELPADLADALLAEVVGHFATIAATPPLRLVAGDRPETELTLSGSGGPPVTVEGPAADLLAWLIGRHPASPLAADAALPVLPPWL